MRKVIVMGLSDAVGGVEKYLLNMQKQLKEKVAFLYLVKSSTNMHEQQIKENQGEIVFIPIEEGIVKYIKNLYAVLGKYREITDTIYFNVSEYAHERLIVFIIANHFHYHMIIHAHAAKSEDIPSLFHQYTHRIIEWICRRFVSKYTRLAVSHRAGEFLYGKQSFDFLPAGIDLSQFVFSETVRREMRDQHHCGNRFVIGFVGRLVDIKNPQFAIDVVSELCKLIDRNKILLMIIGDGPLLNSLQAQAKEKELEDQVVFTGSSNQVNRYMQLMDCLIGTSFSEGMPLSFMEAQAASLPCICAKGNYPPEIGVTDLVQMIPLEEGAETWAKAIVSLMEQELHQDRAVRMEKIESSVKCFDQHEIAQTLFGYLK